MEVFEQKFNVELSDVMPNFGFKAITALKYYQETFARYCAKHNVAGYDVYKMGLKWVFGQTIIKYSDIIPIWNEEVNTKVYISAVKKLRIYLNFEIETKRGLVAKGQSIAYILDLETSRPKPVDEIAKYFDINIDSLENNILSFDFDDDGKIISNQTHKITFSDIDYNKHTNNIAYISLAFETMNKEYISEHYPKTLKIKYLAETFLNDILRCEIYDNNGNFKYKIFNNKDNTLVCIIDATWQNSSMNYQKFFEVLKKIQHNNQES